MNAPSIIKKTIATLSLGVVLCSSIVSPLSFLALQTANAQASTGAVSGYAWAGQKDSAGNTLGVGYIQMDASPHGVFIPKGATGQSTTISGRAWAPNIGWVSFDQTAGCPTAPCTATATWAANGSAVIKGWARACAVFASDCSGTFRVDADLGMWDGWIALANPSGGNWAGGVTGWIINPLAPGATSQTMAGYGWGADVVGWVDFSNVTYTGDPRDFCDNIDGVQPSVPTGAVQSTTTGVASATGTSCDYCPDVTGLQSSASDCDETKRSCSVTMFGDGLYCSATKPGTVTWSSTGKDCTVTDQSGNQGNGGSIQVKANKTYTVTCSAQVGSATCVGSVVGKQDPGQCTEDPDDCEPGEVYNPVTKQCEPNICLTPVEGVCTCPGYVLSPDGSTCSKKAPIIIEF